MRWLRANMRWGVTCAYFALAVQIVLSFGHLHINAAARLAQADSFLAQPAAPNPGGGPKPQPHQPSDDYCPICVLIHLASLMLPGSTPAPTLPIVVAHVAPAIGAECAAALLPSPSFQARAPPIA